MIDPIKTAYIAGYMTCATWEDGDEREYLERLAEELYESDVKDNWYRLGEAVDKVAPAFRVADAAQMYVESNENAYASAPPEALDKLHDIITPLWPEGEMLYEELKADVQAFTNKLGTRMYD